MESQCDKLLQYRNPMYSLLRATIDNQSAHTYIDIERVTSYFTADFLESHTLGDSLKHLLMLSQTRHKCTQINP